MSSIRLPLVVLALAVVIGSAAGPGVVLVARAQDDSQQVAERLLEDAHRTVRGGAEKSAGAKCGVLGDTRGVSARIFGGVRCAFRG
jgi:hypothetical protein